MLNKRFGEDEFSGPKCRLIVFLVVFSFGFFVRGTWDLVVKYSAFDLDDPQVMAVLIFVVYFFTEWMPIFVIYVAHTHAFFTLMERQRTRR